MYRKLAIITGAAQGIGKATAERFLKEDYQAAVVDINKEKLEKVYLNGDYNKEQILIYGCDISDSHAVNDMTAAILKKVKHIDVLVNCAGIVQTGKIKDMSDDEWEKTFKVNLFGMFYLCRAVIPTFEAQKHGKIVNVSSLAGKNGGINSGAAYSASKAGVISLTRTLAKELAPYNINVNAIAPGMVDTEILQKYTEEQRSNTMKTIPLGRFGRPDEIANVIYFLSSEESSYITGELIDINGGTYLDN
ncbi:3-oxoacyl-ACP reductase FabG [Treponema parvum]|uniref:3-oxoacyl-ACP reductase FabG n=1 Tax=Treponema parvum TaxID=138851 RepID=A0A975IEJ7_9SPIR|nr:3-oxoacyl-ACP reductase FabG [Treponema parvum]QTQ13364.1 3-oxoacyl-ACP reductase FabG [Treponema parvum]